MQSTLMEYAPGTLQQGFACATFDGPGQGQVIRTTPFMPFYPQREQILSVILGVVTSSVSIHLNISNNWDSRCTLPYCAVTASPVPCSIDLGMQCYGPYSDSR